ncbi:MAG: sugar ABC transporter permease, partial [Parasporobacterium sp.]|nr:sugar ABC transporter permease [Parasporobacterium sp.]
ILTGGNVDLSIGSTVCLAGAIGAQMLSKTGIPAFFVILICIITGIVIGFWQGFWIGYIHIPPFICTLSGMFLFRGLARVILDSKTVSIKNQFFLNLFANYIQIPGLDSPTVEEPNFLVKGLHAFRNFLLPLIGQDPEEKLFISAAIFGVIIAILLIVLTVIGRIKKSRMGYSQEHVAAEFGKIIVIAVLIVIYSWKLANYKGIPNMLLWVLAVVLIYAFITSRTAFGRYFYAVGGNEKATKLSGIDTRRVYFMAYASMSFLAALSAMLVAARVGSVNGDTGTSFEMDAIGACFIGGASAYGGSGTVPGIMIGAILLGVINQGMSIIGLDNNWQYVVKGGVLLTAVIFDVVSNHKTGKA